VIVITCDWDCNKGINNPDGVFSEVTCTIGSQKQSSNPQYCTDVSDTNQLLIFVRAIKEDFTVFEELLKVCSLHSTTGGADIFNAVKSAVEEFGGFEKLSSVVTDGAKSMTGTVSVNRFPVQWPCDVIGSKPIRISPPPPLNPFTNVIEYQFAWDGVT
jgi:hypothetical protein